MNKIVPIDGKRFLSFYRYAQNAEWSPEEIFFFIGGLITVVLPQTSISLYGGFIPLVAFSSVALGGVVWGWAMYRHTPERNTISIDTGTLPQTPASTFGSVRKAA